jgi:hypothetical protein
MAFLCVCNIDLHLTERQSDVLALDRSLLLLLLG